MSWLKMTADELFDLCDKHLGDWIVGDQEGELVIYTGLKRKGDEIVTKYSLKSEIYGGRNNNNRNRTATYRTKTPKGF